MPDYTVIAVKAVRDFATKYGPMKSYRLDLDEAGGEKAMNVELAQKPTTPAPTVGQSLALTIEDTDYGPKAKKIQAQQGGSGGTWKPRDPAESARITRQHSQEMAIRYAALKHEPVEHDDPSWLAPLVDWFFLDANEATPPPPTRPPDAPAQAQAVPPPEPPPEPKINPAALTQLCGAYDAYVEANRPPEAVGMKVTAHNVDWDPKRPHAAFAELTRGQGEGLYRWLVKGTEAE